LILLTSLVSQISSFDKVLEKAKIDGIDSHDLEIFVEKKVRHLHVKIDLKPAITGLISLDKFATQLSKNSPESLESALQKSLRKRVNRIVDRLSRISGKEYLAVREKRSIEFLGDLIFDIFGNPGPSDWKKVNSNILALEGALKRIDNNAGILHSDIDSDRHIIEQHNQELKSISQLVNRNQNDVIAMTKEFHGLKTFFEISTLADTLDSLTNALVEIRNQGLRGYCSDRAVDKQFLIDNLQNIEANKAGISPVYGSWEWRNYYRYEMCSLALVNEVLWVTVRIPLVKKSERLTRVIPSHSMKSVLNRAEMYGIKMVLFKEKDNDKFHIMTQAAFDLCNVYGNTRTCVVRDVRILAQSSVFAIEFLVDRFMLVSNKLASIQVTEKCPGKVRDITVKLDSVISTPANCSYQMSNGFLIEERVADVDVMEEVGIILIDKLEINEIVNYHENVSHLMIEAITNRSNSHLFEKNRIEINEALEKVNTKHESSWQFFNTEKWIFVGITIFVLIVMALSKIKLLLSTRKLRNATKGDIAELRLNLRSTRDEFRQESMSLHELNKKYEEVDDQITANSNELKKADFSSPIHRSQFL